MRRPKPLSALFATLLLGALPAVSIACGDDSDEGGSGGQAATTTAESTSSGTSTSTSEASSSSGSTGGAGGAGGAGGGEEADPTPEEILGATWSELEAGPSINGKQDDLYFIDELEGWSVNGNGEIYHTIDGGTAWEKLLDQPGTYFRAVLFLDPDRGFAGNIGTDYYPGVTDERPLFSTVDGGVTWEEVTDIEGPTPKGVCNMSKVDDEHLFATGRVGGPAFLLSSSDGGVSWVSRDLGEEIGMLIDSHFSSPTDGYITGGSSTGGTSRCVILHTTDGGDTWENVHEAAAPGSMCWKFSWPSPSVGYASVLQFGDGDSTFVKTTDGGATWQELPFIPGAYQALGVGFITEDIGWIGGDATGIPAQRTADGGETWEADPSVGNYVNRFRFPSKRVGYAIGQHVDKLVVP